MFKASDGAEFLKTCHIERNEKSCISGLTNILRFYPTVEKTVWISDFLLNMQVCLSKNYIKYRGKIWYFIKN